MPPAVGGDENSLDIKYVVGDDRAVTVAVTLPGGGAYDWTGATVEASVFGRDGQPLAAGLLVSSTPVNGTLVLTLPRASTTALGAGTFRYRVRVEKAGQRRQWLAGLLLGRDQWDPDDLAQDTASLTVGADAGVALTVVDNGVSAGFVTSTVGAHEADTTGVHGIDDTAALVVRTHRLFDRGETLRAKLDSRTPCSLTVFGDSTGNEASEWVQVFGTTEMAARWPNLNVDQTLWDDGTQAYPPVSQIRAGTFPTGMVYQDTFTRTVADLFDSTPDLGARWGRDNVAAAGDWSTNGTEAVRTADTTAGTMLADTGHAGDLTLTIPMNISSTTAAAARTFTATIKRLDANNRLIGTITISTSGAASLAIAKVIGGVTTTVGSVASVLVGTAANQTATFTLSLSGTTFTGTVTTIALGTRTATGTLLASDLDALDDATVIGITSSTGIDVRLASITVDALATGSRRALTIRNCSIGGSTLAYQQSRLATLLATPPDLLVLSTGHNYGTTSVSDFLAALDLMINSVRAQAPTTGIAVTSQNPQTLGATGRVAHANRQQALRSFCRQRGVGYVPVFETWVQQARRGVDLVSSDNTHPLPAGSALWADCFADYLQTV